MPLISVLVPVRDAHCTIARTVESLLRQCDDNDAEIILAITQGDSSLGNQIFGAQVRVVTVERPAGVPQLRAAAASAALGDFLVITEDHCTFPAGWLSGLQQASLRHAGCVCGGPVENGLRTPVGWAQYFTRYSAFLPVGGDRIDRGLPGNNACYPRGLLASRYLLLKDGFWEAEFNQELARSGVRFIMLQSLKVLQHQQRGAGEYIALRFRHGRCYGARRIHRSPASEKMKLILFSPLLPALLYVRMLRSVVRVRWNCVRFLVSSPLIVVYVLAWSVGEISGYLVGAGSSCTETD